MPDGHNTSRGVRVVHGGAGNEAIVLAVGPGRLAVIAERVWARVDANGDCWEWTGFRNHLGYGAYSFKIDGAVRSTMAHRLVYALLTGPIPPGMTLDHLCRNRGCCNPDHLDPVPHLENLQRSPIALGQHNALKTVCSNGHPFDALNTYARAAGGRQCRACVREATRRYYARLRAAKEAPIGVAVR